MNQNKSVADARYKKLRAILETLEDAGTASKNASPIVNIVRAFGADPTGATDNGPKFQTAFDTLAAAGLVPYVPAGRFRFDTGVTVPSNLTVMMSGAAVLDAHLATGGPFGPANVLFSSLPTFAGVATTLTAIINPGDKQVSLTSVAGMANGQELFVEIDPGTGFGCVRTITNIVGNVVSVDEPYPSPFPIGTTTAQIVTSRLKNFRLFGNGAVLQGAAGRLFELSTAEDCLVDNLTLAPTNSPAWCASFDTGSRNCVWRRIVTRTTQDGIALEGNENGLIENCSHYMTGAGVVTAFTLNDCVACSVVDSFAFGQGAVGQVGVLIGSEVADGNWGCRVSGGQMVGFAQGIELSTANEPTIQGVRVVGCQNGILAGTGCNGATIDACDVSEGNVIGIAIQSSATKTVVSGCRLGAGPTTTQSILAQGDCEIIGCVGVNGIQASLFGNAIIVAQEDGGGYRPIVKVIGGSYTLDAASGNNTALIAAEGARMVVDGVHYDIHQANCRGFQAVDGLSGTHSSVAHSDCQFTGTAALDGIVVGVASTVRAPRNDLGGFNFTVQAGGLTDRGQVIANNAVNVDVTWPDLQPSDRVVLSMATKGGAPTAMPLVTYTPGTKFTLQSFAGDTSTYDYVVV